MRFVVVGGGLTGLAAAWEWRQTHPDDEVVVLEAGPRLGGKLDRVELAGQWYDTGPEAMLARVPEALELVRELGLGDQLVAPRTTQAAVVLPEGSFPLPAGTVQGVPTSAAGLDGVLAVGRLLRERLGDEVVDRLVEPLLGGVYAGRADELSLAATMPGLFAQLSRSSSVLAAAGAAREAGARSRGDADGPVFMTVAPGIGSLPDVLVRASGAEVRLGARAERLRRTRAGFDVELAGGERLAADAVLLATPAGPTARLLAEVAPDAVEPLAGIPYASTAVVAMAFPAQPLPAGSGLLVPPVTGRLVKGVTVSSAKWPHLSEGGAVRVRSSVGRFGDDEALHRDDAELTAAVVADVAELLQLERPEPLDTFLVRWVDGLPQYLVGHPGRVAAVRSAVAAVPGLGVAGAAYEGVGVPACIRDARRAVAGLA
jgi:oxygen-dependent protoporphyrinogen oxidase